MAFRNRYQYYLYSFIYVTSTQRDLSPRFWWVREKDREKAVAKIRSCPISHHSLPANTNANHNNICNTAEADTKLILPCYSTIMYYVPSLKVTSYLRTKDI